MSGGETPGATDEKITAEKATATPSVPPLQPEDAPPVAEMPLESVVSPPPESAVQADAGGPEAAAQAVESPEAEMETLPLTDAIPETAAEEIDLDLNMNEAAVEPVSEISQQPPDTTDDAAIALTESVEQTPAALSFSEPAEADVQAVEAPVGAATAKVENSPQIETVLEQIPEGPAAGEFQAWPEPEVLDLTGDEPVESETLGADIIEMVELEASQQEPQIPAALDTMPSSENDGGETGVGRKDDLKPAEVEEIAAEPKSELMTESLGDTILLEPADEVLPAAADTTETVAASVNSEVSAPAPDPWARPDTSTIIAKAQVDAGGVKEPAEGDISAEVLKIEKAAQDMVAAIRKQKESLSNPDELEKHKAAEAEAQALKKQKAALAKARALKKQNLIVAKAAALKHKKAAEAKAQALKKQKQAQAKLEAAYPEESVAAPVNSADGRPAVADEGTTSSMMQKLLKKYQGRAIGINYDNSMEIKEAKLVETNREFFSVFVQDKKLHYSYPLRNIFTVIEGKDGVEAGDSKKQAKFKAVIKVYPLVPF
jgi:hypothetical protein